MVIVVMDYGKNMPLRGPFWEKMFAKMSLLLATIEKAKGLNMRRKSFDERRNESRK